MSMKKTFLLCIGLGIVHFLGVTPSIGKEWETSPDGHERPVRLTSVQVTSSSPNHSNEALKLLFSQQPSVFQSILSMSAVTRIPRLEMYEKGRGGTLWNTASIATYGSVFSLGGLSMIGIYPSKASKFATLALGVAGVSSAIRYGLFSENTPQSYPTTAIAGCEMLRLCGIAALGAQAMDSFVVHPFGGPSNPLIPRQSTRVPGALALIALGNFMGNRVHERWKENYFPRELRALVPKPHEKKPFIK